VRVDDLLVPVSFRVIEIGGRDSHVLITLCSNADKSDGNDPNRPADNDGRGCPSTQNYWTGHGIFEEGHG